MSVQLSVIIPAYNEEAWIGDTIAAALRASDYLQDNETINSAVRADQVEVILVDNESQDDTVTAASAHNGCGRLRIEACPARGAARARNHGAGMARGRILVFVDADTQIPEHALRRIVEHCDRSAYEAGITRLTELDGGLRARFWWFFWDHVRRLPLARAKAMPAFMFCTSEVFDELGPFDERVAIGEEWPILAGLYRTRPARLIYDRTLTAKTSSRRMERQPFGYTLTYLKYLWAILHFSGRVNYTDRIR
jgi:glycosyltransferase involved in cell wall biosynthesis